MNIESANIRAHKIIIEDEVGLKLIVIPKLTGNVTYELHDGEGRYIKESRHLKTMLVFISMYFNYSYSLLEENIHYERLRLIKENSNVLKSAQQEANTRVNKEKLKAKPKNKSKPKKPYKNTCPHCSYHRCIKKSTDSKGFYTQYQCKNCLRTHIKDSQGFVIKGDRKNITKKIIKNYIDTNTLDDIIKDINI